MKNHKICPMEKCPLRGENGFCELPDFVPKTYDERCYQETIIFLDAFPDHLNGILNIDQLIKHIKEKLREWRAKP